MNIFVLDENPKTAARFHCDIHCRKMLEEGVQMLCSALIRYDNPTPPTKSGTPHKGGYPNHPCTVWAGDGLLNYQWLWGLTYALGEECEYRFGKTYYSFTLLRDGLLPRDPENFPKPAMRTPFPNCTADWLKDFSDWDTKPTLNGVDKYRLYYMMDKIHLTSVDMREHNQHWRADHTLSKLEWDEFSIWTKRGAPEFMSDRFYAQQCEFFGIKPAELIFAERFPESDDATKLRAKMERKMKAKATGSITSKPKKRRTKADAVVEVFTAFGCDKIMFEGLDKLTLADLDKLIVSIKLMDIEADLPEDVYMPTGRAKKPYIDAIVQITGTQADLSKLTIAVCKDFLGFFGL